MIPFTRTPAAVTIGEALSLAARYWAASWERWVLAVVAVGLTSGLAEALLGSSLMDQQAIAQAIVPGGAIDPATVPALLAGPLAVAVVSLVADWFLVANAIVGLRGGELSTARVIGAGLRVLLVACALAPAVFLVALLFALTGPVGAVALVAIVPVAIYVGLRLQLWVTALFDGLGIVDAIRASWDLTRGAVLRVLGWGLAMLGLSLVLSLATATVTFALQSVPAIPAGIVSAGSTALQAYTVIVVAILYESQRLRSIHGTPAAEIGANVAAVPTGWGQDADPLDPPPPPAGGPPA